MTLPISRRSFALGIAAGAAAVALPSRALAAEPTTAEPTDAEPTTAEPFFAETNLWDSLDGPHVTYHVHALAVLPDDTIVAATEGRWEVCDAGPHDLLIRRSTDGGQTWTPSQVVAAADNGECWSNPTLVVDNQTGEVFLFHNRCERLPENTSCSADSGTLYVTSSTDSGATWSERRELTGLFDRFPYNWAMHGPGPGHGIQLDTGRLLLTVSHRTIITGVPTAERNYGTTTIYSDDHGRTWQSGEVVPIATGHPTVGEATMVQREDGTVVINSRPGSGNDWPRDIAVSSDGGVTWSLPTMDFNAGLFNGCQTSLVRYTGGPRGGRALAGSHSDKLHGTDVDRLLFSRPDAPMRWNMSVAVSYDEGASFRYSRSISTIRGYYSDLAHLSDGTIVLLYGCDGDIDSSPRRVAVARFNLEWLTRGRDSLATGPRLTQRENDLGNPIQLARWSGGAVSVVRDANALGGTRAAYAPVQVGDFIEFPFVAGPGGECELWLRYYRSTDGGLVTVTVDGQTPRNSTVDLTSFRGDGYDVVMLDRLRLHPGRHTIRFTLAGPGRGGGTAIGLDELAVVTAQPEADVREEVTVDNGGLGFEVAGSWPSSRGLPGYYGFNYLSHGRGTGANVARWRPAIPGDDQYEVLVAYSAGTNRATNAPYVVHYAGSATTVLVDQTQHGTPDVRTGEWVSLGAFPFHAGLDGYVELSDAADNTVIADAVRFRRQARRQS